MNETSAVEQARTRLERLFARDPSIGALMEFCGAMEEGPDKAALWHCCGELLHIQFDLIHRITAQHPELDRLVEERSRER